MNGMGRSRKQKTARWHLEGDGYERVALQKYATFPQVEIWSRQLTAQHLRTRLVRTNPAEFSTWPGQQPERLGIQRDLRTYGLALASEK